MSVRLRINDEQPLSKAFRPPYWASGAATCWIGFQPPPFSSHASIQEVGQWTPIKSRAPHCRADGFSGCECQPRALVGYNSENSLPRLLSRYHVPFPKLPPHTHCNRNPGGCACRPVLSIQLLAGKKIATPPIHACICRP